MNAINPSPPVQAGGIKKKSGLDALLQKEKRFTAAEDPSLSNKEAVRPDPPKIIEVKGDGLCLFRALVKGLEILYPETHHLSIGSGSFAKKYHAKITGTIDNVQHGVRKNKETIKAMVLRHYVMNAIHNCMTHANWETRYKNLLNDSAMFKDTTMTSQQKRDVYRQRMHKTHSFESPEFWGTEHEISMFAKLFGVHVYIQRPQRPVLFKGTNKGQRRGTIYLVSRQNGDTPVHFVLNAQKTSQSLRGVKRLRDGEENKNSAYEAPSVHTPCDFPRYPRIFKFQNMEKARESTGGSVNTESIGGGGDGDEGGGGGGGNGGGGGGGDGHGNGNAGGNDGGNGSGNEGGKTDKNVPVNTRERGGMSNWVMSLLVSTCGAATLYMNGMLPFKP